VAIEILEAVDLDDIRVIEAALPAALIQKSPLDILPPREFLIQELYGNRSAEMDVARQPDFRHAAAPEPALENKCSQSETCVHWRSLAASLSFGRTPQAHVDRRVPSSRHTDTSPPPGRYRCRAPRSTCNSITAKKSARHRR